MACGVLPFVVLGIVMPASVDAASVDAEGGEAAGTRFVWVDVDGDGLEDVHVVRPDGRDSLFRNLGDGSFEDVTASLLSCATCASTEVAWHDVDSDRRPDLVRLLGSGSVELLRNRGDGVFEDVTTAAGLDGIAGAIGVRWLDYDSDGRADLELTTQSGSLLRHGLGDFLFEAVTIDPVAGTPDEASSVRAVLRALDVDAIARAGTTRRNVDGDERAAAARALPGSVVERKYLDRLEPASPPGDPLERPAPTDFQVPAFPNHCAFSVRDTSTGDCVLTSTLPTLGKLYPISSNLFVSAGGNVGIGTTGPNETLDVAGAARISGALTLAPSGDVALDVSSGSIYEAGAPFIHTLGSSNMGTGFEALVSVTSGTRNMAFGIVALTSTTTGMRNSAFGYRALAQSNADSNVGFGFQALTLNTIGYGNTAIGTDVLRPNTIGTDNIAIGSGAGGNVLTGNNNILIGHTGFPYQHNTIRIGRTQLRAFNAGIRGVTTDNADAIAVVIDSAGQLGTVSSSRRFKEDIADMGDATARLLDLRPVLFRFKPEIQPGERSREYGLIAEEVAEIFPDLVVYDEEGEPLTVKYHVLDSMLLNELSKMRAAHAAEWAELRSRLHAIESAISPAGFLTTTPGIDLSRPLSEESHD